MALTIGFSTFANNGYNLWLNYEKIRDLQLIAQYKSNIKTVSIAGNSITIQKAKEELNNAFIGLLDYNPKWTETGLENNSLVIGTPFSSKTIASLKLTELNKIVDDGYVILNKKIDGKSCIVIAANSDIGVLYGVFNFIRLLQ